MTDLAAYAGLFWIAFLAATVFPFQSEAVLLGLLATQDYFWLLLVFIATAGNTMGSIVNWIIGRNIALLERYRWFPIQQNLMTKAEVWYQRYGKWSLLLSWAPFIGDPLTIAAGIMRERLDVFVILVLIAKLTRYMIVAAIVFALF